MPLNNRKKILDEILELKFVEQTQEVKKRIQKLQQKIDDLKYGEHK